MDRPQTVPADAPLPLPRCPICAAELEPVVIEGDAHDCGGALASEPDWWCMVCPACGYEEA